MICDSYGPNVDVDVWLDVDTALYMKIDSIANYSFLVRTALDIRG